VRSSALRILTGVNTLALPSAENWISLAHASMIRDVTQGGPGGMVV